MKRTRDMQRSYANEENTGYAEELCNLIITGIEAVI